MSGYFKLPNSSDEEINSEKGEPQQCTSCSKKSSLKTFLPWIWCSLCSIVTVLVILNAARWSGPIPRSTRPLFPTDFITAPEVGYIERYFYNYYDFNPRNHWLELNKTYLETQKLYAGYPNPEIDENWKELLDGAYMEASEEEVESVKKVAPWKLEEVDGKVYMEVGVFHNLHCVDLLRRALNPEYYNTHTDFSGQLQQQYRQVHIYHCIDHLRQALECQSDLTPVPMFTIPSLPGYYASHSVSHTCRDFEAVKKWRAERNAIKKPFGY